MNKTYFISDLHLGHENCLRFDNRPFKNVEELEKTFIENWNNKVDNADKVYCLGDMFWCDDQKTQEILKALNGEKIMLPGNHSKGIKPARDKKLLSILPDYYELNIDGNFVIISHYPIFSWKSMRYGTIHLYGHLHNSEEQDWFEGIIHNFRKKGIKYNAYNVGCMMPYMDYTPRTLQEIVSGAEKYYEDKFKKL